MQSVKGIIQESDDWTTLPAVGCHQLPCADTGLVSSSWGEHVGEVLDGTRSRTVQSPSLCTWFRLLFKRTATSTVLAGPTMQEAWLHQYHSYAVRWPQVTENSGNLAFCGM